MDRVNYKQVLLYVLHGFCVLLLLGGIWSFYRYASNDFFGNAVRMEEYTSTRAFERLVQKHISAAAEYAQLEERFETDGRLNLQKVVETDINEKGQVRNYSLQDALDFGQAIGIVFNSDNRLIILKSQNDSADKSSQEEVLAEDAGEIAILDRDGEIVASEVFNYENYEELLSDQETDHARENNILLSLLYRLSEYYDYRKSLGLREQEESNFIYRLIYIDEGGSTIVSSNIGSTLDSNSLMQYGSYYWYDSKTNVLETNCGENLHTMVMNAIGEKEVFPNGYYELMAAVDTTYPIKDSFYKGNQAYRDYADMIRLLVTLAGLLVLGMAFSFAALIMQDAGESRRVNSWYTESLFLILFLVGIVIYWGVREVVFAFKTRFPMDLFTGYMLILIGYIPGLWVILHMIQRARSRELVSGFFSFRMAQYVELNLRNRHENRIGIGNIIHRFFFQIINLIMMAAVIELAHNRFYIIAAFMALILLLWNLLYFGFSCKRENQRRIIFNRITDMTKGKVGEKLSPEGMDPENRQLAEMVNALDDSLEKAVQSRTRSERMQTEMIANVSHDLRTPLTSILSYVELLRREIHPEGRAKEYCQVLEDKANRLKSLAEALMEASRATSGTLHIEWIQLDMVQMLNQVMGEFYDRFEDQRLEVVVHLVEPPAMVRVEGKILWRSLENLFTNVCKYAMPGTRVYIDLQETTQSFVFTMKNISARKLTQSAEDLTERFIRGDVSRSTEGSGLGLSIVKNMTEQLHGRFELFLDGEYFRARLVFPKVESEVQSVKS